MTESSCNSDIQKRAVELLQQVKQPWTTGFFRQIVSMIPVISVEIVILRRSDSGIEVFLTKRPIDDPDWPSQFHIPGTIVRNSDLSIEGALNRLIKQELKTPLRSFRLVGSNYISKGNRNSGFQQVFLGEINKKPATGNFFNVNSLPPEFIEKQAVLINIAIQNF